MGVLEGLEPRRVFQFFEALCAIPHGSRNCGAVSDWCVAFAKERGLEYHQGKQAQVCPAQHTPQGNEAGDIHRMGWWMVGSEDIQSPVRTHHLEEHPQLIPGVGIQPSRVAQD